MYDYHDDFWYSSEERGRNRPHPSPHLPAEYQYEIKWPDGYWNKYARLKAEAVQRTGDHSIAIVMMQSLRYRVRCSMGGEEVYGPETPDRLTAWQAFLDSLPRAKMKKAAQ